VLYSWRALNGKTLPPPPSSSSSSSAVSVADAAAAGGVSAAGEAATETTTMTATTASHCSGDNFISSHLTILLQYLIRDRIIYCSKSTVITIKRYIIVLDNYFKSHKSVIIIILYRTVRIFFRSGCHKNKSTAIVAYNVTRVSFASCRRRPNPLHQRPTSS